MGAVTLWCSGYINVEILPERNELFANLLMCDQDEV